MGSEILFVLLDDFADWEGAYIASCLNAGVEPGRASRYCVKTVSITKNPVSSIGGFRVLPDYDIHDIPANHAGLVLIGGMRWFTPEAALLVPVVKAALVGKKLVAGICNASVFLGMHGFLNDVKHTSNGLDYLKKYAGANYTGELRYVDKPAVRDENIVTANGFAALEFSREILYALEADSPEKIEAYYKFNKFGFGVDPVNCQ